MAYNKLDKKIIATIDNAGGRKALLKKTLKRIKNKAVDKASDVLSAPARIKSKMVQDQSELDLKKIKFARSYDDAPNFRNGVRTDAFEARSVAEGVKERLLKKRKK